MILWQYITQRLSRYRYLQDGAVWHVQPITVDMDLMRGHCNGTRYVVRQISRRYIEAELACSQQSRLSVLFILRIPLSPTSLLTDVRGGVAMRKSVKHSFFTELHGRQTRSSDENSVCPICLSHA